MENTDITYGFLELLNILVYFDYGNNVSKMMVYGTKTEWKHINFSHPQRVVYSSRFALILTKYFLHHFTYIL